MQEFTITENATNKIKQLLVDEPMGARLRIQVIAGGCNGFQYKLDFDTNINPDDKIITNNNVEVIVDETSLSLLENSTFDFVETLGASNFEFKNPNAASSCGCGNSFAV